MRFSTGLFMGAVMGAAGAGYAMQNRRMKKKIMREGKQLAEKVGDAAECAAEKMHW